MKRVLACLLPMLLAAGLSACEGDPAAPTPAQLHAAVGGGQAGLTEAPLPQDLVARVTDSRGRGVSGVSVAWSVAAGGGTLSAATTTTDAAGEARVRWTLGTSAGQFSVTATVAGLPPAIFSATANLPQPSRLEVVGGGAQVGAPGRVLADSVAVRVVSAEGRVVPGATVSFVVSQGGGAMSPLTTTTSAAGIAKAQWTLGGPGPNAASAVVGGVPPAAFTAYAVPVASITLSPAQPVVVRGDTLRLTAVPRDSVGNALAGRTVTWASSAPGAVGVSADGVVSGLGRGTATVTATSEGRSGSVTVTVAQRPPRITAMTFSPDPVDVSTTGGSVDVLVTARVDAGLTKLYAAVHATRSDPPNGQLQTCETRAAPVTGTSELGTWKCTLQIPHRSAGGTWSINAMHLVDSAGTVTNYTGADLAALGVATTFQVVSANEDVTAPTLTSLTVNPTSVDLADGNKVVQFTFTAADAGTGLGGGSGPALWPPSGNGTGCGADPQEGDGAKTATFQCSIVFPASATLGTWRIEMLLRDAVGNLRIITAEQLQAAGFPHQLTVTR